MSARMHLKARLAAAAVVLVTLVAPAWADITRFVGSYAGSAQVSSSDGSTHTRDMSVNISETAKGFNVEWTSTRIRADGTEKTKSYSINFGASDRDGVFAAAMSKNVFGHDVQLDPMKGEPYVWARLQGETLSVYSLFVTDDGGYELQEYHRTLVADGLKLDFQRLRDGAPMRAVHTVLSRQ